MVCVGQNFVAILWVSAESHGAHGRTYVVRMIRIWSGNADYITFDDLIRSRNLSRDAPP